MTPTQSHILYKPEEMKDLGHGFEVGPSESKAASIDRQICIYIHYELQPKYLVLTDK